MFDLKESTLQPVPLESVPLEPGRVMLLMLAIIILEALINIWTNFHLDANKYKTTPAPVASQYSSIGQTPYWSCKPSELQYYQIPETPIQRINRMKYLKLEHRAKLMAGVRRRLDRHF